MQPTGVENIQSNTQEATEAKTRLGREMHASLSRAIVGLGAMWVLESGQKSMRSSSMSYKSGKGNAKMSVRSCCIGRFKGRGVTGKDGMNEGGRAKHNYSLETPHLDPITAGWLQDLPPRLQSFRLTSLYQELSLQWLGPPMTLGHVFSIGAIALCIGDERMRTRCPRERPAARVKKSSWPIG